MSDLTLQIDSMSLSKLQPPANTAVFGSTAAAQAAVSRVIGAWSEEDVNKSLMGAFYCKNSPYADFKANQVQMQTARQKALQGASMDE